VFGRTPEEVCADHPELLTEVRRRWGRMCAIEGELDALFPTPGDGTDADTPPFQHADADWPRIPGYDEEALLGRRGMGVIYQARHRRLNRLVALKMLIAGAYAGPPERARFQREAEAVASLRHANIVAVYVVGDHEGCPYFTMELLEMLTGRPPFRGETATQTERQVVQDEPVSPSRSNTKVPRDLETICLKCLSKEPQRRYVSASALADDLRRFGEGRPIQARPVGWGERSWRWCRRNPTVAALLVTALALVGLASGGGVWLVQQRARHDAEMRNDVSTAVAQAERLRQGLHFREARESLEQVRQRVGRAGPDDLRGQVDQARADLDLVEHLDDARIQVPTLVEGKYEPAGAERMYSAAFVAGGLGREGDDSESMAARVQESAVRAEIVAALDDWASITPDLRRRAWLLAVARRADPDPVRGRLREPELWQDSARLTRLAREPSATGVSPQLATALGRVSRRSGGDAVALLSAAQARFPEDFWLNFELGWALYDAQRWDKALGYCRAALALRPKASPVYDCLGYILRHMGRVDEAIGYFQQALRLDPGYVAAHVNLAYALKSKGRLDEAIGHLQQTLGIAPTSALIHTNLALALRDKGRLDEAIGHLQQALSVEPKSGAVHYNLGMAL
jgi:eukaryotic-like serine/threonine-protein kinase